MNTKIKLNKKKKNLSNYIMNFLINIKMKKIDMII